MFEPFRYLKFTLVAIHLFLWPFFTAQGSWRKHTIDRDSRGADGVRLADVNGDGLMDVATGWEEGGKIRICLNPGPGACRAPWPAFTVAEVASPEDAMFVDLDRNGIMDVVSCCEGATRTVFVHWAPDGVEQFDEPSAWTTMSIPATAAKQMWMYAAAADVNIRWGPDLFVGSKGVNGSVGWLEVPQDARNVSQWRWHQLRSAGWIMSLIPRDMDDDGDVDVVCSDRKGARRGVFWLENPGPDRAVRGHRWVEHAIGADRYEVMFIDLCDLDQDGQRDILAATLDGKMIWLQPSATASSGWKETAIGNPFQVPRGKAVRAGDIDLDGTPDIVHSAEKQGQGVTPGVAWLKSPGSALTGRWLEHDVSRDVGLKFDLVELLDLDRDGDLDIMTCEERSNLGVIWYENPTR
jgi:hypothetical protein